jgi:hypothetical protein
MMMMMMMRMRMRMRWWSRVESRGGHLRFQSFQKAISLASPRLASPLSFCLLGLEQRVACADASKIGLRA